MAKSQPLSLVNIENGELVADMNDALNQIQDAVLGNKAKGAITLKITVDATKSNSIAAVGYEIAKTAPKLKKNTLYNQRDGRLVAEVVPDSRERQETIPGTNVVELRQQA